MINGIYKKNPRHLHFEPTTDCNARCPQCARTLLGTLNTNPNLELIEWKPEELENVLKQSYFSSLLKVLVNGNYGDIVKHSQPKELLEVFFKKEINVEISTNGGALSTEFWEWLGKQKNLVVEFGIDGLEDTHHLYRRNTRFDVVIKNAKSYIEAGGNASWAMTVFKHNEHQVDACEKLSKELGFKKFKSRDSTRWWAQSMNVYDKNFNLEYYLEPSTKSAHLVKDKDKSYEIDKTTLEKKSIQKYNKSFDIFNEYIPSKTEVKEIGCVVKASNSIYISGDKKLWPCCWTEYEANKLFLKGEKSSIAYVLYVKNKLNLDFNNLIKNSVQDIVDTGFFKIIEDSWKTNSIKSCVYTCTADSDYDMQKKYTIIKNKKVTK